MLFTASSNLDFDKPLLLLRATTLRKQDKEVTHFIVAQEVQVPGTCGWVAGDVDNATCSQL
jgi:hypothetical protein